MTGISIRTLAGLVGLAAAGLVMTAGLLRPPAQAEDPKDEGAKQKTPAAAQRQDEQALRKVAEGYFEALNKGDVDKIMSYWSADAEYVDQTGGVTHGRDAIAALFREALKGMKGCSTCGKVLGIQFIRPDVAVQEGRLELTAPDGTRETTRYEVVWVKSDNRWRITHARDLSVEPGEAGSAGAAALQPLEWLVGTWEGKGEHVKVDLPCRWASNQNFLMVDFTVRHDGEEPKQVTERLGWDPAAGVIRSWVFDSLGGFAEGVWERDGNRWVADCVGVLPGGSTGSSRNEWEFVDRDHFVWRSHDREVAGQPTADAEVKYTRKAAK